MKVLVLDDDLNRIVRFKKQLGDEIICCMTYDEFTKSVVECDFGIIFLDHDLGGEFIDPYNSGDEKTGLDAAFFIIEKNIQHQARIVCHSLNHSGANAMYQLLQECGYDVSIMQFTILFNS